MIKYNINDKELTIPLGLGNLNRVAPSYGGGDSEGWFEEGYQEGFTQGKEEGLTEGYNNGLEIGKAEGYEDGFTQGKTEGVEEGYDNGFEVGKTEGVEEYRESLPVLNITENGTYDTVNKGVNVNVDIPVVDITGVKFQNSTFNEIPQWIDFEDITDLSNMFSECKNLTHIRPLNTPIAEDTTSMFSDCSSLQSVELFDSSNVLTMVSMFSACTSLTTVPQFDLSSCTDVANMFYSCRSLTSVPLFDLSNVMNMGNLFEECRSLTTVPQFNTSKVTYMGYVFNNCYSLTSLPAFDCSSLLYGHGDGDASFFGGSSNLGYYNDLTDLGGFIGLKTRTYLQRLPNLTYQSCINVLNGLYDFTEHGETPNSYQGKLKVHQNFLTAVGDEISIGVNKGWTITA